MSGAKGNWSGQPNLKHYLKKSLILYCALWASTAFLGLPNVDHKFDTDYAVGSQGLGFAGMEPGALRVSRIPFTSALRNPNAWPSYVPPRPWRSRSKGFAIAPFIIVDEIACQTASLGGLSAQRIVFWFFGYSDWTTIKIFWVS